MKDPTVIQHQSIPVLPEDTVTFDVRKEDGENVVIERTEVIAHQRPEVTRALEAADRLADKVKPKDGWMPSGAEVVVALAAYRKARDERVK